MNQLVNFIKKLLIILIENCTLLIFKSFKIRIKKIILEFLTGILYWELD